MGHVGAVHVVFESASFLDRPVFAVLWATDARLVIILRWVLVDDRACMLSLLHPRL